MTPPRLPESVRRRVVDVAAERLGAMAVEDVPPSLRPFQRFTPARRRQVVLPIATALETDDDFRAAVADGIREALPELVAAVESGAEVATVDPDDVAAVAYLLRAPGWEERVAAAGERESQAADASAVAAATKSAEAAQRSAAASLTAATARAVAAEERLARAGEDVERERRRAREASERARQAEARTSALTTEVTALRAAVESAESAAAESRRRAAARQAELEDALERARRDSRESREAVDVRTWLLLDTLARAVSGLREELSPGPPSRRPADIVADGYADGGPASASAAGGRLATDEAGSIDVLLGLPQAHLIVDGYNVTKTGFPDLPLEDQRGRLVSGLGALAARTGAEVTCVFDGARVQTRAVASGGARRVRVVFSPPDEIADEVIKRLVRAEPTGRVVVVCTADQEVVAETSRAGARIVSPSALLTRLART
jgi:predicted RNA-binding protein with PIN domain